MGQHRSATPPFTLASARPHGIGAESARAITHFSLLTSHFALGLALLLAVAAPSAFAGDFHIPSGHPRLLLTGDDVAAIRVRCGTQASADVATVQSQFGADRDALERLRDTAREIMAGKPGDDDLVAPAMMHLASGQPGHADEYTRYVADALLDPERRLYELDVLVALDWCWDAIEPEARARILDRLPPVPERFDDETSPVDQIGFRRKLCDLAGVIVRYQAPGLSAAQTERFDGVIAAGKSYLEGPFLEFCRQRGAMPTSGKYGIWEEAEYTLAVEMLRVGLGRNLWPELSGSLGRSMEHYFYADTEHPALRHGFIHDDGSEIPARPGLTYSGFGPAVPWVIARQAHDPVAGAYANRSLPKEGKIVRNADRYGWVRLAYGPIGGAEIARGACPLGRNFGGGWVAMRTGWSPGETVVLFDAGQPFWRSRQHFDAGQFQIYRKGRLTAPTGDDVTFEATASKQGRCVIGGQPGDWDRYYQATIAHNCVTVADRWRTQSLYGRPWPALGNQRLIGHDYKPSEGTLDQAKRKTGRLLAFETNNHYAYAAADLAPAYVPEVVVAFRREVLLLNAGAVLVLDRIASPSDKYLKTWHLQLPSRPELVRGTVAGDALPSASRPAEGADEKADEAERGRTVEASDGPAAFKQRFGVDANAGIWEIVGRQDWLGVAQQEGRLFVRTLLPAKAAQFVIGGPMQLREIPTGPSARKMYLGSDTKGFEYRLWPATFRDGPTAAYELGRPSGLGPQFGVGVNWGRLDVSPVDKAEEAVFLHLLVPTDQATAGPPGLRFETTRTTATLDISLGGQEIHVALAVLGPREGSVSIRDKAGNILLDNKLATDVQPDVNLPRN